MEYFYILELSVEPGGARKDIMYVLATLEQVYNELQKDLVRDAGLAIWYGEEILLHRCQLNKTNNIAVIIETIDLHERITYYVGDFAPIKFDENNDVIGYHKSSLYGEESKSFDDSSPIDFTSKDIQEVYRYLYYDVNEIFRIIRSRGENGSNMERYPPNIGVQIDLSKIPRIEEPIRYFQRKITLVTLDKGVTTEKELDFGPNDFGG
jgi:hypothetical protein